MICLNENTTTYFCIHSQSARKIAYCITQETEKTRWEEQRKTMQQDAQAKAQIAQYEDELARKRAEAEHHKNRERNKELVLMQQQSVRNQEAEKRRVQEQIEAERRATEKYRVVAA